MPFKAYESSSAQKRLYIIDHLLGNSLLYNENRVWNIEGKLDFSRLKKTLEQLSLRHEILRTCFVIKDGEVLQKVYDHIDVDFIYTQKETVDPSTEDIDALIEHFLKPYDLAIAPLWKVELVQWQGDRQSILMDFHHIIADGTSMDLIMEELRALYFGKELPEPEVQYVDFAIWQNDFLKDEEIRKQEASWLKEFEGEIPLLELPADFPRPREMDIAGSSINFEMDDDLTADVNKLAIRNNTTLYAVLLAVFNILLAKYTNQEDIVVGTPVSGRSHREFEDIIGMFVNTLAMRNRPMWGKTFIDFLSEVSKNIFAAFENQDYQFEMLVEKVATDRQLNRNPLFDVVFVLQNYAQNINLSGGYKEEIWIIPYHYKSRISKFDLTLQAFEVERHILFVTEYRTSLFRSETIERLTRHFLNILHEVMEEPGVLLSDIQVISESEKEQLLNVFNDTAVEFPADKIIPQLFVEQVGRTPDYVALVGADLRVCPISLTYRQLNEQSDRLSGLLIEKDVQADSIVGIMIERSIEMIIGILGILKSGGAYLPIAPDYPRERIEYMLKDSGARIMIGRAEFVFSCFFLASSLPRFLASNSSNLAYIIYTSGSTGRPKAVMVEHRNVVRLVKNSNYVEFRENDRLLQTGALEFDASTFEIWGSLLNGMTLCVAAKDEILNPAKLKNNIRKYNIGTMWLTSPLFNQLVAVDVEIFEGVKNLLVGGDLLSPLHINRVRERFPRLNIINGYGPTENTTFSTTFRIDKEYTQQIPIGRPISNSTAYVVNRASHLAPVGVAGELLVGGEGVSRGYLNNPELTAEKFKKYRSYRTNRTNIIYKTGDLARWLPDGNIEFLGRIDQQVKIRGFRVEPGEIEAELSKYDLVKEAVVIDRESETGEKYLCGYIVPGVGLDLAKLREYLSCRLPDYMIPSYFIPVERIPLTANGKVDRKALPAPGLFIGTSYVSPANEIEEQLTVLWSEVLSIEKDKISVNANFFELGGHSLKAAVLTARIHKKFAVKIPLMDIFRLPTVRELGRYIKESPEVKYAALEPVEKKEYYKLSSAQERLYILQQMDPCSLVYNMPQVEHLDTVDREKMTDTFRSLLRRHESLRTSFEMIDEQPVQRINDEVEFNIEILGGRGQGVRSSAFIRPFDLSRAPLFHVGLIKTEAEKYILMVDIHHIISDGVSQGILLKEFLALYEGISLPALRLQYKDYAEWQNSPAHHEELKIQEQYWLKHMSGELPVLTLPYDYPRPEVQSFEGKQKVFYPGPGETLALKVLAAREEVTPYMMLLTVFYLLLSRLGGQEDIIIGTAVAGRSHADLQQIIGMFVNTLAIRNYPSGEKSVVVFLREVKVSTLESFENQDYQFEELVEKVAAVRNVGRNPLFDVVFTLQNLSEVNEAQTGTQTTDDEESTLYDYESRTAKFDMTLFAVETGDGFVFTLEYCTRLFKEETIDRFTGYFKNIINSIVENPSQRISDVEMLSEKEKRQLLVDFNDTGEPYPNDKTIPQLFAEQAARTPDHIAVVGAAVVETLRATSLQITYRELAEQSGRLAGLLIEKGVLAGSIVGIMVERSIEMIIGILGTLKLDCAYLPIDPFSPKERIDYMLEDSGAKIMIGRGEFVFSPFFRSSALPLFPATDSSNLAYIIYTSGSTGKPKGVLITHANLSPLLHWGYRHLGLGPKDRFLQNLSYYFDWSVWEIFIALTTGASLYMVPKELLLNPEACVAFMTRNDISVLHVTPTQYRYYLKAPERPWTLKYLFIGAEKLSRELLQWSFESVSNDCRVFNMYGPTECTIISAVLEIKRGDAANFEDLSSVPIGRAVGNIDLFILDKYLNVCPVNVWGELYISGDCVARGYLNNPELTSEKFNRSYKPYRSYIFYKTGDLARRLLGGNVEFLGRIDQQVKIRGFRIELGEIESELLKYSLIKEAVVIDMPGEIGENYLCGYIVEKEKFDLSRLKEYLSKSLPDYMIPSYFMRIPAIPLNPNGKLDRGALPALDIQTHAGGIVVAPANEIEEGLSALWAEILNTEKDKLSMDANFFELGGHSLKATILSAKIHKTFDVKIPLVEIFRFPTIRESAQYIKENQVFAKNKYAAVKPAEKKEYYILSSAQRRLYILQQMDPLSTVYNMPQVQPLNTAVDKETLEETFRQLIRRHESLRTSFIAVNEEFVQTIHDEVEFEIEYYDLAAKNAKGREEGRGDLAWLPFICPFDLSRAPLLRVQLIKVGEEKYTLLVDMHHIISDGFSQVILVKEFMSIYEGTPPGALTPLRIHYKDFAEWQNSNLQGEVLKRQEQYWLDRLAGILPVLNLPYDYPRPEVQSFEGKQKVFYLGSGETLALKALAAREDATLYMMLLTLFYLMLSRLGGQEDIIVGTAVAGRSHADLQQIIGMFVNTLAIRNYPSGEKSVVVFLREVKVSTLESFENQDYQFEELVEKVAAVRNVGRNPLFDVVFTLQNLSEVNEAQTGTQTTDDEESTLYDYESRTAKFDMTLFAVETGDGFVFTLEYCTRLFKEETIDRFTGYFKNIINSIVENPSQRISDVEMLSEKEKRQLLVDFNDTGEPYPNDKTIPQLFAEQVERTPDHIAVFCHGRTRKNTDNDMIITYRQLNELSNRSAYFLSEKGVLAGSIVGIMVERSIEMIIGILGTLKLDCAYLPIDPFSPKERIDYMLEDSGAKIMIERGEFVFSRFFRSSALPLFPASDSSNLAYVIYTSGSTGKSKGVPITHSNLCPLLHWGYRHLGLGPKDRFLQNLSYYFDWSVWEIFIALSTGASLYMVPKELLLNPEACVAFMTRNDISVLHVTPTQYQYYLKATERPWTLKYLFIGAEKLSRELLQRSFESVSNDCRVFNMYGPTECTIISAVLEIERSKVGKFESLSSVPIGGPVANIDLFILDKYMNPCPVNVLGELFIAGDCVAHGYLNNPELTAEKFNRSYKFYRTNIFYKTGDLCRRIPDGNIEFLGRSDLQVKIRGFRIEPEEIENRLLKHPDVKEAKVLDKTDNRGDKYLCAYIVADRSIPGSELKEYLSGSLPDYMVPAYFVLLDRIPLTPNGKVDRKALPEPGIIPGEGYIAPGNEIEEKIADIWAEVLAIEKSKISVNTDFFDLGGHSLKVIVMIAKIQKMLNLKLELMQVFRAPTIRGIASLVGAIDWVTSEEPPIDMNGELESEEIIV